MDASPRSHADVIHDLDVMPWPLETDAFDYVRAFDVLEHVADVCRCMDELHRVCRHGAIVHVRMPYMGGIHAATDPTHRRAGASRTFDYFDPTTPLGRYRYSTSTFRVIKVQYERGHAPTWLGKQLRRLDRRLLPLIERHPLEYELYFVGLYPIHNIYYELVVIKEG